MVSRPLLMTWWMGIKLKDLEAADPSRVDAYREWYLENTEPMAAA